MQIELNPHSYVAYNSQQTFLHRRRRLAVRQQRPGEEDYEQDLSTKLFTHEEISFVARLSIKETLNGFPFPPLQSSTMLISRSDWQCE